MRRRSRPGQRSLDHGALAGESRRVATGAQADGVGRRQRQAGGHERGGDRRVPDAHLAEGDEPPLEVRRRARAGLDQADASAGVKASSPTRSPRGPVGRHDRVPGTGAPATPASTAWSSAPTSRAATAPSDSPATVAARTSRVTESPYVETS